MFSLFHIQFTLNDNYLVTKGVSALDAFYYYYLFIYIYYLFLTLCQILAEVKCKNDPKTMQKGRDVTIIFLIDFGLLIFKVKFIAKFYKIAMFKIMQFWTLWRFIKFVLKTINNTRARPHTDPDISTNGENQ